MMKYVTFVIILSTLVNAQLFESHFDGTLPAEGLAWPNHDGNTWDGWSMASYWEEGIYYDSSGLSTSIYHSSPRSLRVTRKVGYYGVPDINHYMGFQYDKLYVDYWVYFAAQGFSTNPGYNIPYASVNVHFLFLETATSFSSGKIDFTEYTNKRYTGNPTCWTPSTGGAMLAMTSNDYNGSGDEEWYGSNGSEPTACWEVRLNTDKWVHMRHCWNMFVDSAYTWIDGDLSISTVYHNYTSSFSDGLGTLIISGWVSQNAQNDWNATFYIDDVMMDTTYIHFGDEEETTATGKILTGGSGKINSSGTGKIQ